MCIVKHIIFVTVLFHSTIYSKSLLQSSNENIKVNPRITTVRLYAHPLSYFLYNSPLTLYGTLEIVVLPKWSLIFQPGYEGGTYVRHNSFTNAPGTIVTKNRMLEYKGGIRKYFICNRAIGPYVQGQIGYTHKDLVYHVDGETKVYTFNYDDWIAHLAGGVSYSYSYFNVYADIGYIHYLGNRGTERSAIWERLPSYDINIGIGVGF